LARALESVILIEDLSLTNKSLRADWQERNMPILIMIRDLATVTLGEHTFYPLAQLVFMMTCQMVLLHLFHGRPVAG
jgi:hypothetical protein